MFGKLNTENDLMNRVLKVNFNKGIYSAKYQLDGVNGLDMSFKLSMKADELADIATISIFNELPKRIEPYTEIGTKVTVECGYDNNSSVYFIGEVSSYKMNVGENGVEHVFNCSKNDVSWKEARVNKSWMDYMTTEQLVKDISKICSFSIGKIKVKKNIRYKTYTTFAGDGKAPKLAKDVLVELAKDCGCVVRYDNGLLYFMAETEKVGLIINANSNSGLIDPPPFKKEDGTYEVRTLLLPNIRLNANINVDSRFQSLKQFNIIEAEIVAGKDDHCATLTIKKEEG